MSVIEPYVEKDGTASGAGIVFGGRRYWLFGYCEGDHIWSDDAAVSSTWTDDSAATGIWLDDAAVSNTWIDDSAATGIWVDDAAATGTWTDD